MMRSLKLFVCTIVLLFAIELSLFAQGTSAKQDLPNGWHLMDKQQDGYYGISLGKAYEFLKTKNLKSKTIVVAVIDSGIDTLHEDLKDILWTNPKEIPGNGIDDDHNGYVDDVHGWNFIGGKDGKNVNDDSGEDPRVYYAFKEKFEAPGFDPSLLTGEDAENYKMWVKAKKRLMGSDNNPVDLVLLKRVLTATVMSDSVMQNAMGKKEYTGNELDTFEVTTPDTKRAKEILMFSFRENKIMEVSNKAFLNDFNEYVNAQEKKAEAKEKAPEETRKKIVQDNENDINDKYYGNNDIMAGEPLHGTHVSGIIAAERNNGKGMDGIADNVRIMMIRAVPGGDEHDKDIALAIRYAVDNGARVINMSFGKDLSPEKKWVDDAVKYAESKNVLLVHAAGNDAADVDTTDNFPSAEYKDMKGKADNWITVGASSDPSAEADFKSYTASFSNYGKKDVDVFAPGTKIYSTLPGGNNYGTEQGTSMAAPVVTGVAALIMEYYPTLTAQQVKYCIEKSATQIPVKVKKPGSDDFVNLTDISTSGGVINAYGAVKMAYTLTTENKKEDAPKSTLKTKKD
ncbi:MAG TPA: S8 family peptidase [Puia sp.]|nr:S8 family peptidase [Puia sp.]